MIRAALALTLVCSMLLAGGLALIQADSHRRAPPRPPPVPERVENLQEELDSVLEDVEDLWEPIEEFDLFDQCMYLIGVTEYGTRNGSGPGYYFNGTRKSGLALDIRGFKESQFQFLSFPGEEPPSIECNEDAEEDIIDR